MNLLMLVVVALVALCYFGGNYCPSILRQKKEMLLGVVIGLVLPSVGVNIEGFSSKADCLATTPCSESDCADWVNASSESCYRNTASNLGLSMFKSSGSSGT